MAGWADGLALVAAVALAGGRVRPLTAQDTAQGKAVYVKWCAGCHGEDGAGDGPAARYMLPRPRDFRGAVFKIRTTTSGALPTDADLMRAIDDGLPGTAMPEWKTRLPERERRDVIAYLKTFSRFFADTSQRPTPLQFGSEPGSATSAEALQVGRQFFDSIGCRKCHGDQGRGDGPSAPTLHDDAGFPIFAADLTQNWRFRGGGTAEQIYHRLRTGLDGTPMPSFSDLIDQNFLTERELWRLAQYVRSLSPARTPVAPEVIHAPLVVGGPPPLSPDDSAWSRIAPSWIPLVGQVIRRERWFTPAVSGVWVQAIHDGRSLAVRVSWDDRSQSPDSGWLEFTGRVLESVAGDTAAPAPALWADQLAIQFPTAISDGMERPYFLMGSSTDPVYQWRWRSVPAPLGEALVGNAKGMERFDTLPGAPLEVQSRYDGGQWRLVFRRSLATPDSSHQLQFRTGRPIPIAFFAWDGSNGEAGSRGAVSTWYFLALDTPTPIGVFVLPTIALLASFGLGWTIIRRTQRASSSSPSMEV
jgi:mono/diheme cytochrome c family protein